MILAKTGSLCPLAALPPAAYNHRMIVWVMALGLAMPVQRSRERNASGQAARARKARPAPGAGGWGKVLTNEDLASAKGT